MRILVAALAYLFLIGTGFTQGLPFPGPGAATVAATISNTASPTDTTNVATHTYSTQSIGTAATGRRIIVACGGGGTGVTSVTGITIDGNAMTSVASQTGGNSNSVAVIYVLQWDTGTTATIAVTFNATTSFGAGCGIWAAYNLVSSTATATGTSTATPLAANVNVSELGVAVAYAESFSSATPTYTWSGTTENFDAAINGGLAYSHSGSSGAFTTAQTPLAISATMSPTSAGQRAMVAASFR